MTHEHLIGPFVRRFLLEELVADRNLSRNTQKSYRDTIRLLFGFVAERYATDPTRLTIEQLDAALVRSFLVYLEDERANSSVTARPLPTTVHACAAKQQH
jgi:integrase/recombinase XerD